MAIAVWQNRPAFLPRYIQIIMYLGVHAVSWEAAAFNIELKQYMRQ